MKYKKLIIVSCLLIIIGLLTSIITLAVNQFNIGNLDNTLISKTYDINGEFDSIECDLEVSDLNIYLTTDEKNYALCLEKENITFEVEVIDNVLAIKETYELQLFSHSNTEVALYLNKETLENLNISTNTGDVCILDAFKIKNLIINGSTNNVELMNVVSDQINVNVSTGATWVNNVITNDLIVTASTGDVEISNCKVNNNVNVKVTTGEVKLAHNEIIGDLKIEGETGDLDLEHITCNNIELKVTTGDIKLVDVIAVRNMTINSSTGFVELEYCDGTDIYITTTTGKVEGSILTNKKFDAISNTGKVNVPNSNEGGICKIRTSTGKINIVVE